MATNQRRSVQISVSEAGQGEPVSLLRERHESRVKAYAMLRSIPFASMSSPAFGVDMRQETGDS